MKIAAVVITCRGREAQCRDTIDALHQADWPETWTSTVATQPWPERTRQHRQQLNALQGLRAGIELAADFILFLEDDLEFNAHIGHNLARWPPLRNGSLGMGSLYNPTIREI